MKRYLLGLLLALFVALPTGAQVVIDSSIGGNDTAVTIAQNVGGGVGTPGNSAAGDTLVSYLIVAGGGGGGTANGGGSGSGGGAGGLLAGQAELLPSTTYTITVGGGGSNAPTAGSNSSIDGGVGTAIGGGAGKSAASPGAGNSGGSGSGGTGAGNAGGPGTPGQGNTGGAGAASSGGGGGGAGQVGSDGGSNGGNGGNGTASSITGGSVTYAGGGGGGSLSTGGTGGTGGGGNGGANSAGTAGTANTGGGGGGGGIFNGTGGAGGSGVVILSIPSNAYSGTFTGSPTVTTSGANTILTFNASGSYTTAPATLISSSDTDVQAWINTIGQSNTTQAEVNILTTMVVGMKSDGSWAKLDRLWINATGTQVAARVDLVARASLTEQANGGTLTWTTQKGYNGDGAASYIDTGFNASTATNYKQNAAFAGLYVQTGDSRTTFHTFMASSGAVVDGPAFGRNNSTTMFWSINQNSSSNASFTFSSQIGAWGVERSGATAQALYYNSTSSVASNATASASVGNRNTYVLAGNANGTANLFANATIASIAFGTNGVMATGFSTRLHTALNAINATNFP